MLPVVGCHVYAAWVLWALGYADQALQRGQEALGLAQALAHPVSEATARYLLSIFYLLRGEGPAAQQQAEVSHVARMLGHTETFVSQGMTVAPPRLVYQSKRRNSKWGPSRPRRKI